MAEGWGMTLEQLYLYDHQFFNDLRAKFGQEYSLETFRRSAREGFLAGFEGLHEDEIKAGSVVVDNSAANEEGIYALCKYLNIDFSGKVDLKAIEAVQMKRYKEQKEAGDAAEA